MSGGKIMFYASNGRETARYVSGTTVYEECLQNGRWIQLYRSSSGQEQRENVVASLPAKDLVYETKPYDPQVHPLNTFKLVVDGQSLHNEWSWAGSSRRPGKRPGTEEAVVRLTHNIRPITVQIVTALDGTPVLTRYLEVTNTGPTPAALSDLAVMSGMLWHDRYFFDFPFDRANKPVFSLGYFRSQIQGEEGNFAWQPLTAEVFKVEKSRGNMFYNPYFIVKNEASGESCFIALGWSENYTAEFALDRVNRALSFHIGPDGPKPLRVIAPGETVSSPKVHIAMLRGNLDQAVAGWHGHVRQSVLPPRPAGKNMYTVAGRVVEKPGDWILREVDIAAEMGAEAFMVDAGWYGNQFGAWWKLRGDWNEGDFLPEGGLRAIGDYVRQKGMLFGMWMEPECLTEQSETFAAHPDWKLKADHSGTAAPYKMIDLANPEAARHVEDAILRVIGDYKLDFYKTDYNQRVPEGGLHIRDGYAENEAWRHYEVIYGIYDRVLETFPGTVLESCAAGGGRLDLGIMSRFHYGCQSDFSYFPRSIRAINGLTLFLPPEALCYYHNHFTFAHETADLDTHLRVTLFATPVFVGFGAQNAERTGVYYDQTHRYIELAKGFCRSIMEQQPAVFHHTPYIGVDIPADWCVLEYAAKDKSKGYVGVFRLGSEDGGKEYVLKPRGIDPARHYRVTLDNDGVSVVLPGVELARHGLSVTLEHANTSELVLYTAVAEEKGE
ncbi:alpha-galactosidase [Paenibacillus cymbidii]|uniref:alpha-galactosidase n=1 Tax=Paenibacillus cymbidii TaxID=1639034 RepID=UPI00108081FB|nr:alpha-galactosidase [Paenibacillus cymbidii]